MQGKLIVIEGLDGSGKATQTKLLCRHLLNNNHDIRKISFPDYSNPSSTLVKMYLEGQLGGVDEVGPYAASSFYSVDRYCSYRQEWEKDYLSGKIIVADRYTTSNASHQTSKLPKEKWDEYLDWLKDFEYNRLGLPEPTLVILLDMHPETSRALLSKRYKGDEEKKDIHEKDFEYLLRCREAAHYTAKKWGWMVVPCCDGHNPFSIEKIAADVAEIVDNILSGVKK